MKSITSVAGVFLLGLMSIFSLNSCSVYHNDVASVDQAIDSGDRVRVVTLDNVYYEFQRLEREGGQLYGIAGKKSDTAKMLADHKQIPQDKSVKIALADEEIQAIYLKNRSMSRLVNYGVPVVGAAGLLTVTSDSFRPDVGN
ncbi:MAG: hypothetical protein WBL27_10300 [Salinimicrobium sp.]